MQWTTVARHVHVHDVTILSALLVQNTQRAVEQAQHFCVIDILGYHSR